MWAEVSETMLKAQGSCRACLHQPGFYDIFKDRIHELFVVINVQILQDDNFPRSICQDCLHNLKQASRFKMQCDASNAILLKGTYKKDTPDIESKLPSSAHDTQISQLKKLDESIFIVRDNSPSTVFIKEEFHDTDYLTLDNNIKQAPSLNHTPFFNCKFEVDNVNLERSNCKVEIDDVNVERSNCKVEIDDVNCERSCQNTDIECSETVKCEPDNEDANSSSKIFVHDSTKYTASADEEPNEKCVITDGSNSESVNYKSNEGKLCALCNHKQLPSCVCDVGKPFKCSQCSLEFKRSANLRRHSLIHGAMRKHKCSDCGKCFLLREHLKRHMLTHGGLKSHACADCDKSFRDPSDLRRHIVIHTDAKPHECSMCGKKFRQANQLKTHTLTHGGEKTYECSQCSKSFLRAGHLQAHVLIHAGTKLHKCTECDKTFTQSGTLKSHMLIHSDTKNHKCELCDKSFRQRSVLRRHLLTHNKVRSHECTECGKKFILAGHLKAHLLTHTVTESRCYCSNCGKGYRNMRNLKRHLSINSNCAPVQG